LAENKLEHFSGAGKKYNFSNPSLEKNAYFTQKWLGIDLILIKKTGILFSERRGHP